MRRPLFIRLRDAIRCGILSIFPRPVVPHLRAFDARCLFVECLAAGCFLAGCFLAGCFLAGCGSCKAVGPVVERVSRDTVYLGKVQVDSIFVRQEHTCDYHRGVASTSTLPSTVAPLPVPDTVFIRDVSMEYRYRLLRDTLRVHEVDSIPVVREVEVVREVRYVPWWMKVVSGMGAAALLLLVVVVRFAGLRRKSF